MPWEPTVDPREIYEYWPDATRAFDPEEGYEPVLGVSGATEAAISQLAARRSLWAAACLTTGFASRTDGDMGLLMVELALARSEQWPVSELTAYCAEHDNLGRPPNVLVNSARLAIATIPLVVLSSTGPDIGRVLLCHRLYDGNHEKVRACLHGSQPVAQAAR